MEFVTFETAKKLKDKGFPQVEERALAMYDEDGEWYSLIKNLDNFEYSFEYFDDRDCVCPTISQVLKWLRDNCTTHLEISVGRFGWYFATTNYEYHEEEKVYDFTTTHVSDSWDSYEEAAIAGIEYVLNNLI